MLPAKDRWGKGTTTDPVLSGHGVVSLCLQPEITLAVFSSNHNKNRERLFQTKRQKIGLWWSFILWHNEQMWDLRCDHPMSTSVKGPGRTPAERGQGICCMWPRSERPVNAFWVCSEEGSWLRSSVTHFEDKVGKCHHGIICEKKVLLMPMFRDFKDRDQVWVWDAETAGVSKIFPGGCQSILVLEANLPPPAMSLRLIARAVMNSSLCSLPFRLRIHKSTCAVDSWEDINHWDMKQMRFWNCMNLFGETGPPRKLSIHVYSTSIF